MSSGSQEHLSVSVSSEIAPIKPLSNPFSEPYIGRQYYLNHIGDIFSAWKQYRGKNVTIAVIDAGFDPYHEDFVDENGNSKISVDSASFSTNNSQITTEIGIDKVVNMAESHGTFCAGVAAAGANGKGVIGVAPSASLLLLKTDLKPKSIAAAFHYAADHGARVVTISIGSYYNYVGDLVNDGSDLGTVFDEPVRYCYDKGIVVVSAAGNGGLDGQMTEFTFPGCVDHVIGAGGLAANSSKEIWSGSSYNSSPEYAFVDVLAPSEDMFGCCHYDGKKYDGGWNGTSFASPIVAGMAALYFEKYPEKTNVDFEADLYRSCHALTQSQRASADQLGHGRVDVGALLNLEKPKEITVKVASNWSSCFAYVWNEETSRYLSSWPGQSLSKTSGVYEITLSGQAYDSIIITQGQNGPQSVDLAISNFVYDVTMNLPGQTAQGGLLLPDYSCN